MNTLPRKCENVNAVPSFCECISGEDVDVAAEVFCKRAADVSEHVTGDELVELKKALKDLEEPEPDFEADESCCEC